MIARPWQQLIVYMAIFSIICLLLKAMMDYVYLMDICIRYSDPFSYLDLSTGKLAFSYLVMATVSAVLGWFFFFGFSVSNIPLFFYYFFVILPLSTYYGMHDVSTVYFFSVLACFFLVIIAIRLTPSVNVPRAGKDIYYASILLATVITVYVYGMLAKHGGFSRLNFNFYNVYEVRRMLAEESFPLQGYLLSLQAYVLNIIFLVTGLNRKKYLVAMLAIAMQILLFGMTNFKAFLFAPCLAILLFYLSEKRNAPVYMAVFFPLLFLGLAIAEKIFHEPQFIAVLMRIFYMPGALHELYYDFFSKNPFVHMADSRFSFLVKSPYGMPYIHVIALEYWKKIFSPNVGYLGDAYANFGIPGMAIFSMLLGMFLKLLQNVTRDLKNQNIAIAITGIPAISLVNAGFPTTLLTHGFAAVLLVLWVLSSSYGHPQEAKGALLLQKQL